MTLEQNKAVVRRFYEAFESNDLATLETVLAPDLAVYAHSGTNPESRQDHLQGINMSQAAFADSHYMIEEQLAEGDRVATRVRFQSTHSRGEFMGVSPSGKQISVSGITIERIKDGRIVERRISYDQMSIMQQLGIIPPH
jgi:steroid delta-isomerase-like uncharacterized protein